MKTGFNPFPDYPVVNLDDAADGIRSRTIPTVAIEKSRRLTEEYLERQRDDRNAPPERQKSIIIPVRGDYGSGKTHLLLDAAGIVLEHQESRVPEGTSITILAPCIETDPIGWYQGDLGARIDIPSIKILVSQIYAKAGIIVGKQVKLTQPAVERLQSDPSAINELIKKNLLNASAVDEEFQNLLAAACSRSTNDIRAALTGLLWEETAGPSGRWMKGELLSERALASIGVSSNLSTDEAVTDLLVALAGISSFVNEPFVLMIDELEHIVRHDIATNSKRNITWLKRLLESLADYAVLVFVSGHWSAWEASGDYLQRFTPTAVIDILSLGKKEVLLHLSSRISGVSVEPKVAETIARAGGGNVRKILSLLRLLYVASEEFSKPVSFGLVKEAANRIAKRVSPQEALFRAHVLLEDHGFTVQREKSLERGINFDLAAYRGKHLRIAVEVKHSVKQVTMIKHLKRFIERLKLVRESHPNLVGYFMSDGVDDPKLRAILDSTDSTLVQFIDLTSASAFAELTGKLKHIIEAETDSNQPNVQVSSLEGAITELDEKLFSAQAEQDSKLVKILEQERAQRNEELIKIRDLLARRDTEFQAKLESLEKQRFTEFQQLQERLAQMTSQFDSPRDAALVGPREDELGPKLHLVYDDLKRPLPFSTLLNPLITRMLLISVLFSILALTMIFLGVTPYVEQYERQETVSNQRLKVLEQRESELFSLSNMNADVQIITRLREQISSVKIEIRTVKSAIQSLGVKRRFSVSIRLALYALAVLSFLAAVFQLLRGWIRLQEFVGFRDRVMREVYVSSDKPGDLIIVQQILHNALKDGPREAETTASKGLAKVLPDVFGYMAELIARRDTSKPYNSSDK